MANLRQSFEAVQARPSPLAGPRLLVDVGIVLAFVAAIMAANYALAGFPNIKLFDLIVFVAGYSLGLRRGAAVAVLAWLVYGNFNPYGITTPTLLVTVMAAELTYVAAGALVRHLLPPSRVCLHPGSTTLIFATAALTATLLYDAATNIYTGWAWSRMAGSSDYGRWIWLALFNPGALAFFVAHIGSNLVFFTTLAPLLIKGANRLHLHR